MVSNVNTMLRTEHSWRLSCAKGHCEAALESARRLGADLILPFVHGDRCVGFASVSLGEGALLSTDQARTLDPLCRQIAGSFRNAEILRSLRERDKLAALGELAAGLAHEIKNPLGAIKGAAQLLQAGPTVGPAAREMLTILSDETDRLSNVVTEFLDYARPRRGQPSTSCSPLRVMEHIAGLLAPEARVPIEIVAEAKDVVLSADPEILKQVLLNLSLNAMQAMEQNQGRLTLRLRGGTTRVPRGSVEIAVEDTGPGIPPEARDRVFMPFFTTKPKGSGLGLAICQRLVEGMKGTISVTPNLPSGCVFTVRLPA